MQDGDLMASAGPSAGPLDAHAAAPIAQEEASLHRSPGATSVHEDVQTLTALLRQFRQRLDDPLLSLPDPKVVRRRLFQVVPSTARRSRRIAAKRTGVSTSAVKRAQRILMRKLGICRDEERLSDSQLEEYAAIFASPLGPEQVEAITALFGLSCPSVGECELAELAAA
jgi:hypothetical protein